MAHELGMPIGQYLVSHTRRQHLAWLAWLDLQWDQPSRTDSYLMMIAAEIRRVLSKRPNAIKLEHFRLRFKQQGSQQSAMTKEQATAATKARWLARMTVPVEIREERE